MWEQSEELYIKTTFRRCASTRSTPYPTGNKKGEIYGITSRGIKKGEEF